MPTISDLERTLDRVQLPTFDIPLPFRRYDAIWSYLASLALSVTTAIGFELGDDLRESQ